MPSVLSCVARLAKAALARGPAHRLANLDDHTLRDIGLRRTDLYAFADMHRSRIEAACCRMRDLVPRVLAGRRPAPCC
jgi:Domain of unknown function (DUF1127)